MRQLCILPVLMSLTACGIAPTDIAIGGAVTYALYGDEIEQIPPEEMEAKLKDPDTYRESVPPQAKQGARRVAENVRHNVRHNAKKFKEWWFYDPTLEKKEVAALPPSYCYRIYQDIMCYPGPVAGWEARLVGYQGTGAVAPPRVITQPLPKLDTSAALPATTRLETAEPVFDDIPEEVKKEPTDGSQPLGGAAQETLPDPLISPQL